VSAPLNLARLRALLEAATPGPWTADLETLCGRVWVEGPVCQGHYIAEPLFRMRGGEIGRTAGNMQKQADAALIVAAVNALPALLGRVERAEAELARDRADAQQAIADATCREQMADAEVTRLRARVEELEAALLGTADYELPHDPCWCGQKIHHPYCLNLRAIARGGKGDGT
jgi:hypothetical protein